MGEMLTGQLAHPFCSREHSTAFGIGRQAHAAQGNLYLGGIQWRGEGDEIRGGSLAFGVMVHNICVTDKINLAIVNGMNGVTRSSATRISATVPSDLAAFLDEYQQIHQLSSRSAALAEAIRALRERVLDAAYQELGDAQRAGQEIYPADNLDGLEEA